MTDTDLITAGGSSDNVDLPNSVNSPIISGSDFAPRHSNGAAAAETRADGRHGRLGRPPRLADRDGAARPAGACRQLGVKGSSGMRKSELIAAIREHRGETNGPTAAGRRRSRPKAPPRPRAESRRSSAGAADQAARAQQAPASVTERCARLRPARESWCKADRAGDETTKPESDRPGQEQRRQTTAATAAATATPTRHGNDRRQQRKNNGKQQRTTATTNNGNASNNDDDDDGASADGAAAGSVTAGAAASVAAPKAAAATTATPNCARTTSFSPSQASSTSSTTTRSFAPPATSPAPTTSTSR